MSLEGFFRTFRAQQLEELARNAQKKPLEGSFSLSALSLLKTVIFIPGGEPIHDCLSGKKFFDLLLRPNRLSFPILLSTEVRKVIPPRPLCTQSIRDQRRTVTIRPYEQFLALNQRRAQENTKEFQQIYAKQAGIEGTISQGVRTMGLRRSRYIGQEKTHLQHIATAAALNLVRSLAWERGVPRAQTRCSSFACLYDVA